MSGFLRRYTSLPSIEVIRQIEGVVVVDQAPPDPATGVGSGAVLLVGEFEDGPFAGEVKGALEVYGSADYESKFGGFGYTYGGVVANNPSARRHLAELWNGNGWLKSFKLRAQRLFISRVDTSVGAVAFSALAALVGGVGPFQLTTGDTLSVTTDAGTGSSAAISAAVATVTGSGASFGSVLPGESFGVRVDGGQQVTVTFAGGDTTQAAVIARINAALGYAAAATSTTQIALSGIRPGTGGSLVLSSITSGLLAKLGLAAGTTAGTGNVADVNAVTSDELVALINGTVALSSINARASKTAGGQLRVYNSATATTSTLLINSGGPIGGKAGFPLGTTVGTTSHNGGTIPAGTRVRTSGGAEWVTMQTLVVPAAAAGPYLAKVRPALDDGTAVGATANTVQTLVDPVAWVALSVSNPAALTVALNENALDNAYAAAFAATLDDTGPASEANYLLSARRSDSTVREGRANVLRAAECGITQRIYITGDPLGTTTTQIVANVANYRSESVFYTGKGLRVRIPQIATRGEAGGLGFTADGVITVRPDGPLATICALLAPEENPGQQTNLIDDFFEVDAGGEALSIDHYIAFRRAGVEVPRLDKVAGMVFQSGVTSSLDSGRTTAARRKMANFIQDSLSGLVKPFSKKLGTQSRRDACRGVIDGWLDGLLSASRPEQARILGFTVDDGANAGNTAASLALGVFYVAVVVKTPSSMDDIVLVTQIGPNAVVTREVGAQ